MSEFREPWDDAPVDVRIWDPAIPRAAVAAGAAGAVVLGTAGGLVASGAVPIAGLGQWGAAGVGPAVVAAAAVGLAVGGLLGGVAATLRLPAAPREEPFVPPPTRLRDWQRWAVDGAVAGLVGAVVAWLVAHAIGGLAHGALLGPSRLLASGILGRDALHPGVVSDFGALMWGWVGLLVARVPWGLVLGALTARWPALVAGAPRAVAVGAAFGAAVWLVDAVVLGPLLRLPAIAGPDALTVFLVHTPAFGVPAALWLHWRAE